MRKDGSKLYVELSFSIVKDAQGAVIGAMAIGRDITARYEEEKARRAHVGELEPALKAKQP
jgi:PAS domain S-box-containing protein